MSRTFPPEDLFRRPDIADARQQFFEIVPASDLLQPFVVERKALDDVFSQPLGRPDAKLRAPVRLDPVADRDDNIQL